MNEEGDIVLDSLPYIDGEMDLTKATELINRELRKSNPNLQNPEIENEPEKFDAIDLKLFKMPVIESDWVRTVENAQAQLEYQALRAVNLEVLAKVGSKSQITSWRK